MGSSSRTHGRSARTILARASRARSPADNVAPSSPSGSSMPRVSSWTRTSRATSRNASHRSASVASGRASRRLSAMDPATNCGCWGSQATCACHDAPPTGDPWDVTVPSVAGSRPARTARRVDLPHPDGPVTAVTPRAGIRAWTGASAGTLRPGYVIVRPSITRGAPGSAAASRSRWPWADSSRSAASNVAAPSAAAWNSAPTRRSGQYASGARSRTTSAVERSSEPCASRTPTVTATSATDNVATSSRTAEEAKAMRRVRSEATR